MSTLTAVSKTSNLENFSVWAGTVIGREHVRLRKNNQDAAAFSRKDGILIAVVADGCSSSRASEVGARLGAEWIAANTGRILKSLRGARPEVIAEAVVRALLRYLTSVLSELPPHVLAEMFLFTILVAVVERERTFIFGIGDGAYALNGELVRMHEPAPPYLAYRLCADLEFPAELLRPVLRYSGLTSDIHSLVIGTDGLLDLDAGAFQQLIGEPAYFVNNTLLHKKLAALSETTRKLFDDTTLILIRRAKEVSS
jgi:serine/threonine protein phosphatase PrpC